MIADIAAIFQWPLSELAAMPLDEMLRWRALAIDRFKAMQPRWE